MRRALSLTVRLAIAATIWVVGIPLSIHLNLDHIAVRALYGIAWGVLTVAVVVPHFFWGGMKNIWRSVFPLPQDEILARAEALRVEAATNIEIAGLLEKEAASMDKKPEELTVGG